MKTVKIDELYSFCEQALKAAGMSEENARITADVLITTDTFGVNTHGVKNLYAYVMKAKAGGLDIAAEPSTVAEGPAWAILDGNCAIGMVTATKAMKLAIKKAEQYGIGYVGVRNSCHFGAAGYYANLAAKAGMFGMSMSNGDPVMAVPGGKGVTIGNNPFAYAMPAENGRTIFLDIALSSVAALKIITAKEKGNTIPNTWLVDEEGLPTTDASGFPGKAALQPMAAHKGYGLAVMVELLASVLTGAGMLREVPSWNLKLEEKNNVGHAFIAINPNGMLEGKTLFDRIVALTDEIHTSPKAKGTERIFLPGEIEWGRREKALRENKLVITDVMADNLKNLAELTDVAVNIYEED